jgi:hypothetical protein
MMSNQLKKAYVAVKTRYCKADAACSVLDHSNALRAGYTSSVNIHSQYTKKNAGIYAFGCKNATEVLQRCCERYKEITGRKARKDFNVLFEHVVILSEFQYAKLEKQYGEAEAKKLAMKHLFKYAQKIKKEFGFEPMAIDFHLDEGHFENNVFVRNVHAHISFFNYDFVNCVSNLRKLLNKGKDSNGKTNQLNPHFVKMQDLAAEVFQPLGFSRGESKNVTGKEHLNKEQFVKTKLRKLEQKIDEATTRNLDLKNQHELQKSATAKLTNKIKQQEEKHTWLKQQIEFLSELTNEMETAIKKRCKKALRFIINKVTSNRHVSSTLRR